MIFGTNARVDYQLQPKRRFISFFFNDPDFRNEFSTRSSAASGSIIRRNGGCATHNLVCNSAPFDGIRKCVNQANNSQSKFLRSRFQLGGCHTSSQSELGNRQSAIPLLLQMAEVLFCFHRGGTTGAGGGHGLLVNAIGHVPRNENAGMFAFRQMPGE